MKKECLVCGIVFNKPVNCSIKVWQDTKKFCSYKCKSISMIDTKQSKIQVAKKTKHPRTFICKICGKKINNSRGQKLIKFCSQKCHAISMKGNSFGFKKGRIPWNNGLPGRSGKECNFWQGGIYKNPYPVDWTETLRRSIRERDRYICQICGKPQGDKTHHIHHIDYNKENCNPKNLITLCCNCHMKTNSNRKKWKYSLRDIVK